MKAILTALTMPLFDVSLSTEEILNFYVERWDIEVFFRDCKTKLAFDKYQIRSAKGIRRFWLLTSLAHLMACLHSENFDFSQGYHWLSDILRKEHIRYIYEYGKQEKNIDDLFDMLAA